MSTPKLADLIPLIYETSCVMYDVLGRRQREYGSCKIDYGQKTLEWEMEDYADEDIGRPVLIEIISGKTRVLLSHAVLIEATIKMQAMNYGDRYNANFKVTAVFEHCAIWESEE